MEAANKILLNSSFLYIKTGITVFISIFYSRYLLEGLGVNDYGIYNLVGGVVGLSAFITATLSNSSTRYIAKSLGENDYIHTKIVFASVIYVINKIVFFLAILLELVGVIFINFILKIPEGRLLAANIVYHFMIITTVYSLIVAPYSGLLFSREKIVILSSIEIIDTFLKLGIAILLTYSPSDNLILYGGSIASLSFISRTIIKHYSRKTEEIARIKDTRKYYDKSLIKNIIAFSSWNLLESIGIITVRQGTIFLINIFFGVALNAAHGIASVVNLQLSNFSSSFLRALQPLIYRSFGEGNNKKQSFLTLLSSKAGIILLSLVVIPMISDTNFILNIWLINVPPSTLIFIKFTLLWALTCQLSYGLIIAMQANGRIKELQVITFILLVLNLPISYVLFKLEFPVYYIYIVTICLEAINLFIRIFLANKYIDLNYKGYLTKIVLLPALMVITILLLNKLITNHLEESVFRFFLILFQSFILIGIISYSTILNKEERMILKVVLVSLLSKLKIHKNMIPDSL